MNTSFATVREISRSPKVLQQITNDDCLVVTTNGIPKYFIANFEELKKFQQYKEWQRLEELEPEEIISEIQDALSLKNIQAKKIPSMEEQLADI